MTKITKTYRIKTRSRALPDLSNHDEMNLDILPEHVMEEAKSGDEIMEEDKPDEDPLGWGRGSSKDHQDVWIQEFPSSPDRSNGTADASNRLPDHEMEDPETSECATRIPDAPSDAVGMSRLLQLDLTPKPLSPRLPPARHPNRWHKIISRRKSRSPRRHVRERNPSASRQFTCHINLDSVIQRFGAGDAEVGQWAAAAHRNSRAHAAPRQKTEQMLCTVYLVVSLPERLFGDLMMFLESLNAFRSSKIHTATDSDHKSFLRPTVTRDLSSLLAICLSASCSGRCLGLKHKHSPFRVAHPEKWS